MVSWPDSSSAFVSRLPGRFGLTSAAAFGSSGFFLAFCCAVGGGWVAAQDAEALQQWGQRYEQQILPLIKSHCLDCHNGEDASGEFDLSGLLDGPAAIARLTVWDQVGKRIRLNEMPPSGSQGFSDPQKGQIYAWLDSRPQDDDCRKLATDETQAWYQGVVMSRRLTRTEYLNAIRDLLGVPVDARFEIPSDGAGGVGFDTHGSTLFTSPIHVEQYLAVAADAVERALATPEWQSHWRRAALETPAARAAAQATLERFAWRAWRRPVLDAEVQRLLQLYDFGVFGALATVAAAPGQSDETPSANGVTAESHRRGLQQAMTGILVSPNFLFVVEAESPQGGVQPLSPHELATRLALFLWSSVPDEALLEAAAAGRLSTDEEILAQTQRMLRDPRSRALGENFGLQWLGLANFLTTARPDAEQFPEYDPALAVDLREEVVRTISQLFRENRSLETLIDSPMIEVNGRLAAYYGLPLPAEADWQAVTVGDAPRGGLLTAGAVLVHTSYPRRTSPVLRGRWLLEEILGSKVPPPPPGVPALDDTVTEQAATLRERLERHRQNPECAACHDRMDPLGFGLENFDALGRWRETDQSSPIDARGTLPSGQSFVGPQELKRVVLQRSEEFQQHFVRKLLGFALGRGLTKFDDCVIDDAMKALQSHQGRVVPMVETLVLSYPFRHRYFKAAQAAP